MNAVALALAAPLVAIGIGYPIARLLAPVRLSRIVRLVAGLSARAGRDTQ